MNLFTGNKVELPFSNRFQIFFYLGDDCSERADCSYHQEREIMPGRSLIVFENLQIFQFNAGMPGISDYILESQIPTHPPPVSSNGWQYLGKL